MSGFLSRRLDPEIHGTAAVTTGARVVSLVSGMGLVLVALYLAFTGTYNGRFMPGVAVGGRPLAGLTYSQAFDQLKVDLDGYRLRLDVVGQPRQVSLEDLGAKYDVATTLATAYELGRSDQVIMAGIPAPKLPPLRWAYNLDQSKLASFAKGVAGELGVVPKNANIVIKSGVPTIEPDVSGWGVNDRALQRVLVTSLAANSTTPIPVRPHVVAATVRANQVAPAMAETQKILATPLALTYNDQVFRPDAKLIGDWIAYEVSHTKSGLTPRIDSTRLKDYINQISNQINIAPINHKVTIENGISKVTQEGINGLAVDQDALVKFVSQALLDQTSLTYAITTKPVAFKTETTNQVSLDYGRYIEINLKLQRLWVYQDKEVILTSALTSGATGAGLGTVTGLFSIYYKTTNTRLRGYQYGYDYDVPVKYWMPFYGGYGLHDAAWRSSFGGADYYYNGSHGCVNLPESTAAFIYNWASIGTPVWVHN